VNFGLRNRLHATIILERPMAVANQIKLSATRRETLAWLALLIMQQGTICLWRLEPGANGFRAAVVRSTFPGCQTGRRGGPVRIVVTWGGRAED